MSDINAEWKELKQKIGNFICHMDSTNARVDAKLKTLQEKEEEETDWQSKIDKVYNKGMQDLYDALCIFLESIPEMREIFGSMYIEKIIPNYSPKEIIDKVNQWKAEKDKKEQELHIGDEVITDGDIIGIITSFGEDLVWISFRVTPAARGLDYRWVKKENCKKTGRHFDSIPFDYNPEKGELNDLT